MRDRVAKESALLRRTARQSRGPLVTILRFVTLIGAGVNLASGRPIERVSRKRSFLGQINRLAQGALRIARIGPRKRAVDGNHRAGVLLIKQVIQS